MSRRCDDHRHHRDRRSRSCGAIAVAVRVSLVGAATAAAVALYRQFRSIVYSFAPSYVRELENSEDSESNRAGRLAELRVAKLFEGIPGVEVYQSLRIPDPGNRGRREIDIVLLTKRDLFVVEVKNWSGPIHLNHDGSWVQIRNNGSTLVHPNLLEDLNYRADLLDSYIERRGVTLPAGIMEQKVFLVNRGCRPEQAITMQREVISADQWEHFFKNSLVQKDSGWLKNALSSEKAERTLSELERKQLHYILSTAPTWDRLSKAIMCLLYGLEELRGVITKLLHDQLISVDVVDGVTSGYLDHIILERQAMLELEDGKIVVGEFQGFKGRSSDTQILSFAKRSAVSQMVMTHRQSWINNIFGTPKVLILVTLRDYRDGNVNLSSKKQRPDSCLQTKVRSETQIVFQTVGTSKPQQFSIGEVLSLSLSS